MGIGTRNYARPYIAGGGLPYGVKLLLIANVAVFLLQVFGLDNLFLTYFALRPASVVGSLMVWQLVTYMFLHADPFHILFNMLAVWMFGRNLEQTWGTPQFLRFYFASGIGAGICVVLLNYLLPWGAPAVPTIGASGAVYGILIACALLWPNMQVIFFIFPIQLKYLVIIFGAIAFLGALGPGSTVSHIGHLGGLLTGWLYLRSGSLGRMNFDPIGSARQAYKRWRLERNKRKFQVYLKKHRSDHDPWVN